MSHYINCEYLWWSSVFFDLLNSLLGVQEQKSGNATLSWMSDPSDMTNSPGSKTHLALEHDSGSAGDRVGLNHPSQLRQLPT